MVGAGLENRRNHNNNNAGYLLCRHRKSYWKDGELCYTPFKWSLIDVGTGQVLPTKIPNMPPQVSRISTSAVISSSFIFVVGGQCSFLVNNCPFGEFVCDGHPTVHYIDLNLSQLHWKSAPDLFRKRSDTSVVDVGGGKIFVCGGDDSCNCPIEYLDINEIQNKKKKKKKKNGGRPHWTPLQLPFEFNPEEDTISVSTPIVLDANRGRIIMHFNQSNTLRAYFFLTNSWKDFDDNFGVDNWSPYSVVVPEHDVLYSLRCDVPSYVLAARDVGSFDDTIPHSLHAYDLVNKTWLDVTWSSKNLDKFPLNLTVFSSYIFHLGNGKLCILNPSPTTSDYTSVKLMTLCLRKSTHGLLVAEKESFIRLLVEDEYDDFIYMPQEALEKVRLVKSC